MLPGIRFLLAAILLSMSILIFGLGAAALLRVAHEEVANVPTRRVMPEPLFAQQPDAPLPTLALLRLESAAPEKAADAQLAAMPVSEPAPEAIPAPGVEIENLAVLKLEDIAPVETPKPDVAVRETPAPPPAAAEPPAPPETKLAAIEAVPSLPVEMAPVPFEPIAMPAMTDAAPRAAKTAVLGSPAAQVEKTAASEKSEAAETKRRKRAERARERRRQAARRARLAAQLAAAAPQTADPFSQFTQITQAVQPATTVTTTRRR